VLYVGAIVVSSIPGYYKHRYDPSYRAVGASGATSAVLFAAILFYPTAQMAFPPGPFWLVGLLFLGYEWFMSKRGNDGIAHDAHFYGALYGILFTLILDPLALERCIDMIRLWWTSKFGS
jgi:membrane associated rhomboid family serine protease